jgi:hypothetical protein
VNVSALDAAAPHVLELDHALNRLERLAVLLAVESGERARVVVEPRRSAASK